MGVMSLFGEVAIDDGGFDERPKITEIEFEKMQRLAFEKEMLGLYVSDHPCSDPRACCAAARTGRIADLAEFEDTAVKMFGGIITGLSGSGPKRAS